MWTVHPLNSDDGCGFVVCDDDGVALATIYCQQQAEQIVAAHNQSLLNLDAYQEWSDRDFNQRMQAASDATLAAFLTECAEVAGEAESLAEEACCGPL